MKVTPQRIAILKEIQKMGHPTIEEVYESILKEYPSISLATIYKNIASLCEAGLLKEVKVNMQKQRYEVDCHEHAHLVCTSCGKLEDLTLDLRELLGNQKLMQKIKPDRASITIYGKCRDC